MIHWYNSLVLVVGSSKIDILARFFVLNKWFRKYVYSWYEMHPSLHIQSHQLLVGPSMKYKSHTILIGSSAVLYTNCYRSLKTISFFANWMCMEQTCLFFTSPLNHRHFLLKSVSIWNKWILYFEFIHCFGDLEDSFFCVPLSGFFRVHQFALTLHKMESASLGLLASLTTQWEWVIVHLLLLLLIWLLLLTLWDLLLVLWLHRPHPQTCVLNSYLDLAGMASLPKYLPWAPQAVQLVQFFQRVVLLLILVFSNLYRVLILPVAAAAQAMEVRLAHQIERRLSDHIFSVAQWSHDEHFIFGDSPF